MASELQFLLLRGAGLRARGPAQVVLACVDHGNPWFREDRGSGRRALPGHPPATIKYPIKAGFRICVRLLRLLLPVNLRAFELRRVRHELPAWDRTLMPAGATGSCVGGLL
jgi:hypothetical protein